MASGQPMVSSLFAQDSVNPLSFFLKKSYGDGRVASVAGIRWCWEPLATDLHIGGQGRMVVFLHIEARVGSGSHLGDGAALSRDSTAPPMGEGSRKGDLKKACLTSILSAYRSWLDIYQCGRNKQKSKNDLRSKSKKTQFMCWYLECQDAHEQKGLC